MATSAVSVTTTATEIINENRGRIGLIIENLSTQTVYLGDDTNLTTSNGITLPASERIIFDFEGGPSFPFFHRGDVYGIVSSGTADVRVWEITETRI